MEADVPANYGNLQQQNREGFNVPFQNQLGLMPKTQAIVQHDGILLGPYHVPIHGAIEGMAKVPTLIGVQKTMGNILETPTPTTCLKSTAVHLQFVRQYAPHLYRRAFLASKLRRKGNPAIRLPFLLQCASHLYGSTPRICTAVLLEKYWGLGSPERF